MLYSDRLREIVLSLGNPSIDFSVLQKKKSSISSFGDSKNVIYSVRLPPIKAIAAGATIV